MVQRLIRCLCKTIIRLILFIFLIIGLVLAVVGGVIFDGSLLLKYIPTEDIKAEIEKQVEPLGDNFPKEYTEFNQETVNEIVGAFKPLGQILLLWGLGQTFWALLGLIVGCFRVGLAWAIYVVCMACVATVFCFMTIMIDRIPKNLVESLLPEYGGLISKDVWSIAFTGLMYYYKCCGVRNYKDFKDLENWPPKDFKFTDFLPEVPFVDIPGGRNVTTVKRQTLPDGMAPPNGMTPPNGLPDNLPPDVLKKIEESGVNPALLNIAMGAKQNFETPIACCKDLVSGVKEGCFLEGAAFEKNNNMYNGCLRMVMKDWKKVRDYLWLGLVGLGGVHAVMVVLGVLIVATTDPETEEEMKNRKAKKKCCSKKQKS